MRYNKWNIPEDGPHISDEIASAGYTSLLSAVLSSRGFKTTAEAESFLKCDYSCLHDPFLMKGMIKAVKRLKGAIERRERVAVYGDYDVDGITSGCLITDYLASRGLDPELYIPDRIEEGYGLNKCAIKSLSDHGVTLIVTVDCGVTAISETQYATALGVDMIITDHHECCQSIPDAVAVINPKLNDSGYPFRSLAGVGVAFKLVCAVHGDTKEILDRYSDMVAVGTIADVVPLLDENRYLVQEGVRKLKAEPRLGLGALIAKADLNKDRINSVSVGFTVAPRINAAGRLGMASVAVSLLLEDNVDKARELAGELCTLNRKRQELEAEIWRQVRQELGAPPKEDPVVLCRQGWHQGVIGIVASRLAESYNVPAVMISLDGEYGKGSCRSCGDWSLYEALTSCSEHLESFGGHALAAGLTIKRSNFESFKKEFSDYYRQHPPTGERAINVDLIVTDPNMLSLECAESVAILEPFGQGNPRPALAFLDAVIESVTPIADGRHVRLHVNKFFKSYECVFFSQSYDDFEFCEGDFVDLAFYPQVNEFRGKRGVQILVTDIREAGIYKLCRKALMNDLSPREAEEAVPGRADFARLWRKLTSLAGTTEPSEKPTFEEGFYKALRLLATNRDYLKAAIVLSVFAELGLMECELDDSRLVIKITHYGEKVDLQESEILCRLKRNNITPALNSSN